MSLVLHKHKVKRLVGKTPAGNNRTRTMIAEEVHVMNGRQTHCGLDPVAQMAVDHHVGMGEVLKITAPGVKLLTLAPEQLVPSMEVCYICKYWALHLDSTPDDVKKALRKHGNSS